MIPTMSLRNIPIHQNISSELFSFFALFFSGKISILRVFYNINITRGMVKRKFKIFRILKDYFYFLIFFCEFKNDSHYDFKMRMLE